MTNNSRPSSSDGKLQCCCGRPECAYLENNNTLLGGIERDLETAARLGQVRAPSHDLEVSEAKVAMFFCSAVIAVGCGSIW